MSHDIQNWLDKAIHNADHLETVSERMLHYHSIKDGLIHKNKEQAIKGFKGFYEYIEYDHNAYGAPQELIKAAMSRTHFFHGMINSLILHGYQSNAYTYSLMIVYHNKIDQMTAPDKALSLTFDILDDYFKYVNMIDQVQMGEFSKKTITIIDMNIEKNLNTQMIADALNLNPDYLGRKVKEETGNTITELIYTKKINLAKFYLDSTNLPVMQIADNLGFKNASYFGKVFKKYMGVTPSEYKNV